MKNRTLCPHCTTWTARVSTQSQSFWLSQAAASLLLLPAADCRKMRFPFSYDWVTLSFFPSIASWKMDRKGRKIRISNDLIVTIEVKNRVVQWRWISKRAAHTICCWLHLLGQRCRENELGSILPLDRPSLNRGGMSRKLVSPDDFAPFPVTSAQYQGCAKSWPASNPLCRERLSTTSARWMQRQGSQLETKST